MATITVRGEQRVRKVIAFDGGTGNGAVDEFVSIFPATGRVGLKRLYIWCTESLASTGAALLQVTTAADAGNDSFFRADAEAAEDARNVVAGGGFYKCQGLSFDYELMKASGGPFVLDSDLGFYVSGFAITNGTLVIDGVYEPVTDDGALAGDDHSSDLDDYIAAAVWAAVSRTLTAGTNLNDLSASDVRDAVGLASANLDTQLAAIPTLAELQSEINDVQTDIAGLNDPDATAIATAVWANATRTLSALGFTLQASDLAANTIGASELAADAITEIVTGVWTTALTEAYNTDGAAPTGAQALFVIMQRLLDFAISGTTITVNKIDGTTAAYTLTLNDASNPTSSARAT